jgi:uncharacterized protein YvpB
MTITKNIKIYLLLFILIYLFLGLPLITSAAEQTCGQKYPDDGKCVAACSDGFSEDTTAGICSGAMKCCHEYGATASLKLQIPLLTYTDANSIYEYIGNIYTVAIYIIIPIAIIVIIFAGIQWASSAGSPERIKESKTLLFRAFLGIGMALFSYVILSVVGITQLNPLQIKYISPILLEEVNTETPLDDRCVPENTSPECVSGVAFNNPLLLSAQAAQNCKLVTTKCKTCANVPELKQNCPDKNRKLSYGGCGTLSSSGCGIASLTMAINYLGKNVTVEDIIKIADQNNYRRCPYTKAEYDSKKKRCNTNNCGGTNYDIFVRPGQKAKTTTQGDKKFGPSKVLQKYNLNGEILVGQVDSKGNDIDAKETILKHLEKGHPIIISTGNKKVTGSAHFIVLIGCENCFDDKKRKVYYRDPNRPSGSPFTPNNKKYKELFDTIKAAFWIYSGGSGSSCGSKNPCMSDYFCNTSGVCMAKRPTGGICTRTEMCLSNKCDLPNNKCL